MWELCRQKANPRWTWHAAIDRKTGQVLTHDDFGRRKTKCYPASGITKNLLVSRDIVQMQGAYKRYLPAELHSESELKKLTTKKSPLRTRIKLQLVQRRRFASLKSKEIRSGDWTVYQNRYSSTLIWYLLTINQ